MPHVRENGKITTGLGQRFEATLELNGNSVTFSNPVIPESWVGSHLSFCSRDKLRCVVSMKHVEVQAWRTWPTSKGGGKVLVRLFLQGSNQTKPVTDRNAFADPILSAKAVFDRGAETLREFADAAFAEINASGIPVVVEKRETLNHITIIIKPAQ